MFYIRYLMTVFLESAKVKIKLSNKNPLASIM